MAPRASFTRAALFSFLLFLGIEVRLEAKDMKRTDLVFYMHDWKTATKGQNVTNVAVAGNPKHKWGNKLEFGSVFVLCDPMTLGIETTSTEIGQVRGTYITSALDGSDSHLLVSLVFHNKEYNGSTIEIQGADRFFLKYRDVSVVSGTGYFKLTNGWATLETIYEDVLKSNKIIRWSLSLFQLSITRR